MLSEETIAASIMESIRNDTPPPIVGIMITNSILIYDCIDRIKREGSVVRDLKGNVIAHPSIKIKQDADAIIADLVMKFKRMPEIDLDDEDYE